MRCPSSGIHPRTILTQATTIALNGWATPRSDSIDFYFCNRDDRRMASRPTADTSHDQPLVLDDGSSYLADPWNHAPTSYDYYAGLTPGTESVRYKWEF